VEDRILDEQLDPEDKNLIDSVILDEAARQLS
jgi:hypothetical protein